MVESERQRIIQECQSEVLENIQGTKEEAESILQEKMEDLKS